MTDTTHEAPERIWLQLGAGDEGTHTWADHQVGWDDEGEYEPEYIRADLVQAAVAAALREAAKIARASLDGEIGYDDTLALITPDEQAALDRVVAARFGMVRAEVVRLSVEGKIDREAAERLLAAIRKGRE